MDIVEHNRIAWNVYSKGDCPWSVPVSSEEVAAARSGECKILLTPNIPAPKSWLGQIKGKRVLCLASGGGQQVPLLAAAGGVVTSFDNSEEQLAVDRKVCERESLAIQTVRGDMADLSVFENESFDLICHPVSNVFCEDILPVWRECYRVLSPGGRLLAAFMNPAYFLFDHYELEKTPIPIVKYALPYSDLHDLDEATRKSLVDKQEAFEFSHSIETQIGGQLKAGFVLADLYEDSWDDESTCLNQYFPIFIATLAMKKEQG